MSFDTYTIYNNTACFIQGNLQVDEIPLDETGCIGKFLRYAGNSQI